jgi:WD40 repeat protein
MSQSPDGGSIITGAGDETLKIWKVFPEVAFVFRSKTNPALTPY